MKIVGSGLNSLSAFSFVNSSLLHTTAPYSVVRYPTRVVTSHQTCASLHQSRQIKATRVVTAETVNRALQLDQFSSVRIF